MSVVRDIFGASEEEVGVGRERRERREEPKREGGMDSRRACYRKEERTRARLALDIYIYVYIYRARIDARRNISRSSA